MKGYDLVFADNSFFGCGNLLKEKLGIPTIVDYSAWGFFEPYNWRYGLTFPLSYIPAEPIPTTNYGIPFLGRCLNVVLYAFLQIFIKFSSAFGVPSLKDKHGIAPEKTFNQLVAETDLVLVPLDWALERPRPIPPSKSHISRLYQY